MQTVRRYASTSPLFRHFYCNLKLPFFSSSFIYTNNVHTLSPHPNPDHNHNKSLILNYLTESLGFPKPRALSISNRFSPSLKTTENPQSVVQFLKIVNFSDADVRSLVHMSPQILFYDVDKILKPKIQLFQDLGLTGSDLGKFFSKNPIYLVHTFDERLNACMRIVKKVITNDRNNEILIRTLQRCNWVELRDPESRLLASISYLESYGIVGSQLAVLMSRQPRILMMRISELKKLISMVMDMGFSVNTGMFVQALYTFSCLSSVTIARKIELFRCFGFSEVEFKAMFRRAPGLLRVSEGKLRLGFEFFLGTAKFEKDLLVYRPQCLMHSLEERVIPRYRVLQTLKSKRLLKKEPKFREVIFLAELEFLEKFISRFNDNAEELLLVYKGGFSDSSSSGE